MLNKAETSDAVLSCFDVINMYMNFVKPTEYNLYMTSVVYNVVHVTIIVFMSLK